MPMIRSVLSLLACASSVFAQGAANNHLLRFTQQHGYTFSTIGDAGNAPAIVDNWHPTVKQPGPTRPLGGVDYDYRIATTEVTWRQYFEFVQAYAPVMPVEFRLGIGTDDRLTPGPVGLPSPIQYAGLSGGVPQFTLEKARADQPATSTWHLFARMVNWLHNGAKPASEVTSADFETGAYDTSTFGRVANGPTGPYHTDQDSRSPGAKFWIPNIDELAKATYYDPNRDGPGQGGYWQYGHSSDDIPVPGDPALGGETNSGRDGVEWPAGQFRQLDSGSYPDVQSPWGLLDTVGGGVEWTETWSEGQEDDFEQNQRLFFPTGAYRITERAFLGDVDDTFPTSGFGVLRIAALVPAPSSGTILITSCFAGVRRRR